MLTVKHVEHVRAERCTAMDHNLAIHKGNGTAIGACDAEVMTDYNDGSRPLER